ncbi:MAG: hypothetical protein OXH19_07970 [Chloroflexi bacterium]|nr:hypothetical protein [Chloroflexota bacterium]MCY3588388.1 hypothetical protein [Chloroflexota bacterium]MCY3686894.1 hypothetical protein [Chloroflexota bacterium]MDE2709314.1 hypothetical protein [Chloroflexota bacterium]
METISNRWIGLAYKWLLPLALVASIGVAAVTVISARSEDGNRTQHGQQFSEGEGESEKEDCEGRRGHGKFGAGVSALAELVGTDVDGLKTALAEGKTLAEIAGENGVDAQTVIDALVVKANERIDAAVEAGKLTDEEAETKKSEAATRIEDVVNNGFDRDGMGGWGKGRWQS